MLVEDSRSTAAERRKVVEVAHDESARLERIITNVLELTRVRGGALRPEPVPVDAADLVRVAVQRLHRLADHRTISIDFDPELPPVWVDPTMLEHVVVNLLENVLRYSPGDTPIEVCAVQVVGEQTMQTMQTVQIVDHGSGIGVEDRDRIFDEFVRLDRHRAPSGTGLGLAIVRAFVEANGGDVRCDDTPGGGATFVVTLPNVPGEERA